MTRAPIEVPASLALAATTRRPSGKSHSQTGQAVSSPFWLGHRPRPRVAVAVAMAHQVHDRDEEPGIGEAGGRVLDRRDAGHEPGLALVEERVAVDRS